MFMMFCFQFQTLLKLIQEKPAMVEDVPYIRLYETRPIELLNFQFWVLVEVLFVLMISSSNFLFLATRSFLRIRIDNPFQDHNKT